MRARIAAALLTAAAVGSPLLHAAVLLSAHLEADRIPVGASTVLQIEASYLDADPTSLAQLASWTISVQSSQPRVANGRFSAMEKPHADGGAAASPGLETPGGRAGIRDSCRLFPGAGVAAPFAFVRIPVTGYAKGRTSFSFDALSGPLGITVLDGSGKEWSVAATPPASLTLEVLEEREITIPSTLRRVPVASRTGQRMRLQFPHQDGAEDYLEYADQPLGPWMALPGGPQVTGDYIDQPEAEVRYYRVRRLGATGIPPQLAIHCDPIFEVTGTVTEVDFDPLSGWTHFIEMRDDVGAAWTRWAETTFDRPPVILPEDRPQRSYRVRAETSFNREIWDSFLIAGQSNAALLDYDFPDVVPGVWKLDTHTRFVPLQRPVDAPDFLFVDAFPASAATALTRQPGHPVLVIPCALGGTSLAQWLPGTDRRDPTTLFGRAQFRRLAAAPAGLRAIWYYGHEASMTDSDALSRYAEDWAGLVQAFREECGPVPVIYAQVGRHADEVSNALLQRGAELQRLAESGASQGLRDHHMVVTFDLPLFDAIHLTPAAHRILGERFALATRQHVYGEPVNGTGPRLRRVAQLAQAPSFLTVQFDRPINEAIEAYDQLFRAFADGQELAIQSVRRGLDTQSIQIELATVPSSPVSLSYGDRSAGLNHTALNHVIRDADGLPAPRFGPLVCPTSD